MIFAQISDLHILRKGQLAYGVVDTATMLAAAVDHLGRLPFAVDFVLATGDLVDHGTAEEYAHLAELLAPLKVPCFFVLGNHDEREALRATFSREGALVMHPVPASIRAEGLEESGYLQYTIDAAGLRILILDTVVPGEGGGALCTERLRWLRAKLEQHSGPTVIAMHHPPFDTGIAHMDAIALKGAADYEQVVVGFPQIRRIVCGHLHRSIQADFGGTTAMTAPSVAHQVVLDLGDRGAPPGSFPRGSDSFVMEPPGYLLHWWNGQRLTTHQCVIGNYPGPFPFRAG